MWRTPGSAPQRLLLLGSVEPDSPSQLFVCSVTDEVNRFNRRYRAECSAVNTLVMGGYGRQEGSLFKLIL